MSPSGGDASVAAFGSTHHQQTLQTFYDGFGGVGMATTTVENTPEGTLVVDIFDSSTKKLIWRGIDTKTLSDKTEKNIENLNKAVQDMFKHFPPQSNG